MTRFSPLHVLLLAVPACSSSVSDSPASSGPDAGQTQRADAAIVETPSPDAAVLADAGVPPSDGGCVPQVTQLLANNAFDAATKGQGWQQTVIRADAPLITDQDGVAEQTAPFKAWLGGFEATSGTVTDKLWQDVTIPANTTNLVLTGYYDVRTGEAPSTTAFDTARVVVTHLDNTTIATVLSVSNAAPKTAWTTFAHAFSQNLSGKTVRIRVTSTNDDVDPTSFFFDSFALLATHGCAGPQ